MKSVYVVILFYCCHSNLKKYKILYIFHLFIKYYFKNWREHSPDLFPTQFPLLSQTRRGFTFRKGR